MLLPWDMWEGPRSSPENSGVGIEEPAGNGSNGAFMWHLSHPKSWQEIHTPLAATSTTNSQCSSFLGLLKIQANLCCLVYIWRGSTLSTLPEG